MYGFEYSLDKEMSCIWVSVLHILKMVGLQWSNLTQLIHDVLMNDLQGVFSLILSFTSIKG